MFTQYIIFIIKQQITPDYSKSAAMGFYKGHKNEFETAVVNEPSVFEPLKFCCICFQSHLNEIHYTKLLAR